MHLRFSVEELNREKIVAPELGHDVAPFVDLGLGHEAEDDGSHGYVYNRETPYNTGLSILLRQLINLRVEGLVAEIGHPLGDLGDDECSVAKEHEVEKEQQTADDRFEVCVFVQVALEPQVERSHETQKDHV